jgi:dihydrodipicolinate synthase/N-acetylneuraminate lyase
MIQSADTMPVQPKGLYAALWSPTDSQGDVDTGALRALTQFLTGKGIDQFLVLGSTGQFLFLNTEQRIRFVESVAALLPPSQLVVNISDLRPQAVTSLAEPLAALGVAGASILPPYYFPVDQEDLQEYFIRTAEAVSLPLYLYNFPERTGNRISLETVEAVAQRVPVAAVKQSGSEFSYHRDLAQLGARLEFSLLTGSDTRMREAFFLGATGCISGIANAVPELVQELYGAVLTQQASSAEMKLSQLEILLSEMPFPLSVQALIHARGLPVGAMKTWISPAVQGRYDDLVTRLQRSLKEWNLA